MDPTDETGEPTPTWTPRRLVAAASGVWRHAFPDEVVVRGQVARTGRSGAGHRFPTLVDEDASTQSVGWNQSRVEAYVPAPVVQRVERTLDGRSFEAAFRQGTLVEARGRIGPKPGTGAPQLEVRWMAEVGVVDVVGERRRMAALMAAEDWVAARPPLPPLVTRVAALVSVAGDADLDAALRLTDAPFAPAFLRSSDLNPQSAVARQQVPAFLRRARAAGVDVAAILFGGHLPEVSEWDAEPILRAVHEAHLAGLPVVAGFAHGQDQPLLKDLAHDLAQASAAVTRLAHHNDRLLGEAGPTLARVRRALDGRVAVHAGSVRGHVGAAVDAVPAAVARLDGRGAAARGTAVGVLDRAGSGLSARSARSLGGGADGLRAALGRLSGVAGRHHRTLAGAAAGAAAALDRRAESVGDVDRLFDVLAVVTDDHGRPLGEVAEGDRIRVRHRRADLDATVTAIRTDPEDPS